MHRGGRGKSSVSRQILQCPIGMQWHSAAKFCIPPVDRIFERARQGVLAATRDEWGFMRIVPALARMAFWTAAVSLAVMIAAGFGTRLGLWHYETGTGTILPIGMAIGLAAVMAGLVWYIAWRATHDSHSMRYGLIGLIGSALMMIMPLRAAYMAEISPPICDITTDTERPPEFKALLSERTGAENPPGYDGDEKLFWDDEQRTVREVQRKVYGDIRGIRILMPPETLFARAQRAAESMGWAIVSVAPDQGRIEATDTTFFFGFVTDIVIRVEPSGMGAKLDIRAKSRVGRSDDGSNAERIRGFFKKLANS